jgi:serine phosphatase RsbU (regulator of sigma subunit)
MKPVRFGLIARVLLLSALMLSVLVGVVLFLALKQQRDLIVNASMKEVQARLDPVERRTEWIRYTVANLIELQRLKPYYTDQDGTDGRLFSTKRYTQLVDGMRAHLNAAGSTSLDDTTFRQMLYYASQLQLMEDRIATAEKPEDVKQQLAANMLAGRYLDALLIQRSNYLDALRPAFAGLDQSRYRIQTVSFFFQAHFDTSLVEPSADLELEIQRIMTELSRPDLDPARRQALWTSLRPLVERRYRLYRLSSRDINLLRVGTDPDLIASLDAVRNAYYARRPVITSVEKEYVSQGRHYTILARTLFMKPAISERARKIVEAMKDSVMWRRYVDTDRDIANRLKPVITEMARIRDIQADRSRDKSSSTEEVSRLAELYQQYDRIQSEREKALQKAILWASAYDGISLADLENDLKRTEAAILETEKRINARTEESEKNQPPEEQAALAEDRALLAELKRQVLLKKKLIAEYYPESAAVADAFRAIRDVILLDKAVMHFDYDTTAYISYTGSAANRNLEQSRWSALRRWIRLNCSELNSCGGISLQFISGTGEFVRPRRVLERIMWDLDAKPVDELAGQALFENTAAFTRIFSDQSAVDAELSKERHRLLDMALSIGLRLMLIALLVSLFFVQSIKRIISGAERIGAGDLNVRFEYRGSDELGSLVSALNRMTVGLRQREKMLAELSAAEQIQRQLLPERTPENMEGYLNFGQFYRPSSGVGGDYYDFMELDNDRMAFCIADVTGHGPGPAMIMAMMRAHLHSLVRTESSLKRIMEKLNDRVYTETPADVFITVHLGVYSRSTGDLEYASAGHNRGLVFRYQSETVEEIPGGGLPLGLEETELFMQILKPGKIHLERGDLFFQYTDGVNEASNASYELFGIDRLKECIRLAGKKRPELILEYIARQVEKFSGRRVFASGPTELDDDIAMIAFRRIR